MNVSHSEGSTAFRQHVYVFTITVLQLTDLGLRPLHLLLFIQMAYVHWRVSSWFFSTLLFLNSNRLTERNTDNTRRLAVLYCTAFHVTSTFVHIFIGQSHSKGYICLPLNEDHRVNLNLNLIVRLWQRFRELGLDSFSLFLRFNRPN